MEGSSEGLFLVTFLPLEQNTQHQQLNEKRFSLVYGLQSYWPVLGWPQGRKVIEEGLVEESCSWHGRQEAEREGGAGEGDVPVQVTCQASSHQAPSPKHIQLWTPKWTDPLMSVPITQPPSRKPASDHMRRLEHSLGLNHNRAEGHKTYDM